MMKNYLPLPHTHTHTVCGFNNLFFVILSLIFLSFLSCTKDASKPDPVPVLPTITTTDVSAITTTTASSGGNITSDGGAAITTRGICWGLSADPTVADTKTSDGAGLGSFKSSIVGLTPGTAYHARAYAKNTVGVAYGTDVTFITNAIMYDVTIFSGINGTVTAPKQVASGGKLDITAVPNLGYMTDSITVNGVKFNLNGTNSYTVMNNLKPPVITVTFKMDVLWTLLEKPWVETLLQERNHLKGGNWTAEYHKGEFRVEKYDFHSNGMVTPYLDGNQAADLKYQQRGDSLFVGVYPNGIYGDSYKIIKITRDTLIIRSWVKYVYQGVPNPTKDIDSQMTLTH